MKAQTEPLNDSPILGSERRFDQIGVDLADLALTELGGKRVSDLVFIDLEYGLRSLHQVLAHVMVASGPDLPVVIRVPSYDPAAIVVPSVTSAEGAAAIAGGGFEYAVHLFCA